MIFRWLSDPNSVPLDEDGIVCDALFHRFRLTFDLAWKLLKAILDYEGIEVASPRSAIREAWKLHLITDAEKWLDMQQKRNLTAHTYNESTAREITGWSGKVLQFAGRAGSR